MDNIQKRHQRDFIYQYKQEPTVPWSDRGDIEGKMFSLKKNKVATGLDGIPLYDYNLFIYKTKIATLNTHIDTWDVEFRKFTADWGKTLDHFLHEKTKTISKDVLREFLNHSTFMGIDDINLCGMFMHEEALEKVFIPFIDRKSKLVLNSTKQEWDAIMTQIRLLNI